MAIPDFYPIVDGDLLGQRDPADFARELALAGVEIIQYRHKSATPRILLANARSMALLVRAIGPELRLIMNDRADLCRAAGFDGVHLGQDDLSVVGARRLCPPPFWVGLSTHNPQQIEAADAMSVDYLAIGPVFATVNKQRPDPVVGLEGVRQARRLTKKPLVAIGGITKETVLKVREAGADGVAVIGSLLQEPAREAEAFLRLLRQ